MHRKKVQDEMPLPAKTMVQWARIMDKMASSKGFIQVFRQVRVEWVVNVDRIVEHILG